MGTIHQQPFMTFHHQWVGLINADPSKHLCMAWFCINDLSKLQEIKCGEHKKSGQQLQGGVLPITIQLACTSKHHPIPTFHFHPCFLLREPHHPSSVNSSGLQAEGTNTIKRYGLSNSTKAPLWDSGGTYALRVIWAWEVRHFSLPFCCLGAINSKTDTIQYSICRYYCNASFFWYFKKFVLCIVCTVSSQLFMTHHLLLFKKNVTCEILSCCGAVDRGMIKRNMKQKAKFITF
jgi:hypothetical protein